MGILSGLGWLFSGVLKFFPGLPTLVVYALAALAVVGLPAGYAWHKGAEGKSAAVAQCKSACAVKIADAETAAERAIAEVLSEVAETKKPSTPAEIERYCRASPALCRTGAGK